MTSEERQALRERFRFRCGYCGAHEQQVGSELTVDHFQPRSRGGTDAWDNLVYCCHACNAHKGAYWRTDPDRQLLHPLRDVVDGHIAESEEGTLHGLTRRGERHIARLRLNRPALVARRQRRRRREAAQALRHELLVRLTEVEHQVAALRAHLETLRPRS